MTFKARMLEGLTLDAVQAESIAQHLQLGETKSHFNPEVTDLQRIAILTEHATAIFHHGMLLPDNSRLQKSLIALAATALVWAELIDAYPCTCLGVQTIDDALEYISAPCRKHGRV